MRKKGVLILASILFVGCFNYQANLALQSVGVFEDSVVLDNLGNNEKEIVFIPMHHLGTVKFYNDVKKKVDSLKNLDFYFFTELVKADKTDTITIRKSIKLKGVPFSRDNMGYKHFFDSIFKGKVKLKKELINQPKYHEFGLDDANSRIVDVSGKAMIDYYEKKYGELKLQPCDFEKSFYEKPDCKDKPISNKIKHDVFVNFRNKHVIDALLNEKRKKIAVIYGADHFKGIKEALIKQGYH